MIEMNLLPIKELREQNKIQKFYFFWVVFLVSVFFVLLLTNEYLKLQKLQCISNNKIIQIKLESLKKKLTGLSDDDYANLVEKINILQNLKKKENLEYLFNQLAQCITGNIELTFIQKISNTFSLIGISQNILEINLYVQKLSKVFADVKLMELNRLGVNEDMQFKISIKL